MNSDSVKSLLATDENLTMKRKLNSAYMKVLMNYFQTMNIINILELKWHSAISKFQSASQTLSGGFFKVISLECIFKSFISYFFFLLKFTFKGEFSLPKIYLEAIVTIFFPFILVLPSFYYLAIFCKKKVSKNDKNIAKNKVILTLCVALYSFQPTILSILVQMSMCESFNFGSYLKVYLLESCDSTLYLSFYYDLVLPLLIIFSIFLPGFLAIYISIKKYRGQLFHKEVMQKIGFIITGYKKQNFYWLVNIFCFFLNFF